MVSATAIILGAAVLALVWAAIQFLAISKIPVKSNEGGEADETTGLTSEGGDADATTERLLEIYTAIYEGAESFLKAEYTVCFWFVLVFSAIVLILVSWGTGWDWVRGAFTMVSFVLGAGTSIVSGYLGMKVAVYSNVRTTVSAQKSGWTACFNTAFRAGAVMGFALCGLGILMLYLTMLVYRTHYPQPEEWIYLTECLTGYGLGGSSIAMFGRVGGGIYTKAADVGADLVGKVVHGIPEDDPRNPATIADNVGDNVGDVAGMGSDLFGSFAESTCAALVIGSSVGVSDGWDAMVFPIIVSGVGVAVCLVCSFLATDILPVRKEEHVETALKVQLISTTLLMIPAIFLTAFGFLPTQFALKAVVGETELTIAPWMAASCVIMGTVGGLIIGLITEYFTSHSYRPVREVADACKTGPATNMIYGIALGYKSVIIPVVVLALVIYGSFRLCDMYGVALAAIGFLSNLATGLTIDVYGPVCDNAGGIAEMAELDPAVREKTDALDAAGNTTAAIGKGFAIGSAALVSLALFGAFVTRIRHSSDDALFSDGVNMLEPLTFAFLIIGGMIPFAFAAMTMKSVGFAAMMMVMEVQRQFDERPHLLDANPTERPDYDACIKISTEASLKEMLPPGAMVILTPLLTGILFGVNALSGLLVGALIAAVQLAISMSNSGGAWDNAKKYIEKASPDSDLKGKGSDIHKAAVVGDTVGDPFKDTSGPALNIVMKLMAVLSLVFADTFYAINNGGGLFHMA
uniref:H(+)-exporting diphosphatase n=1 Tax=Trieres chinensis TaxID=1514140 RepID=A0A7S2A4D6_TRICV|mmetsp:Transcript_39284/g.80127  ORF Transcript_39284/g.80127 Transcript_39284/m.80127 type:complete len:748 (+) Transcript_39284:175-2418(+)|eukprot:CAMPEP_0183310638 /NCGR_PEP_ID=MMETSP0160_2-20130417/32404_1 /TAXON_ID=2839 ORGANISM="Odontella Sinensis, Strain Grunow 1884" /NCGR_SAMPLE_ID=MMETSP0160_2 /ASSEMBLY_ACC=CAM_ASM_000250 /LENGTH=747 /DNA_ID=CAMNT_0025474937 /DNA_START=166 /DNA_END=2409 /DNA_ORIENTATION=-